MLVPLLSIVVAVAAASPQEVRVDGLVDFQLSVLRDLAPAQVAIGNLSWDQTVLVSARLGDMRTLLRRGEAYISNVSGNALSDSDTVGLGQLTLDAEKLICDGEDLGPANVTILGSGVYFHRTTHYFLKNCTQNYQTVRLTSVESAQLTVQGNTTDITGMVNGELIERLNAYMETPQFKKFADQTFSQCKHIPQSAQDVPASILQKLFSI